MAGEVAPQSDVGPNWWDKNSASKDAEKVLANSSSASNCHCFTSLDVYDNRLNVCSRLH